MIENCQGEIIDFDMSEAEKLEKRFEEYMELGCWPQCPVLMGDCPDVIGDLYSRTWGYHSALEEIKWLQEELLTKESDLQTLKIELMKAKKEIRLFSGGD